MDKKKTFKIKKIGLLNFPQISRFFNAKLFYDLVLGFIMLFFLSLVLFNYLYPVNSFERARVNLFLRPADPKSYVMLSDLYLAVNDMASSRRELTNALTFASEDAEKAEITRKILEIEKKEKSKEEIEAEILKWERIAKDKPNYRDAYFRLAVLNYQIYKNDRAREFLEKTMAIDPNFEEGKRLRELL